jgi:nuclear GTP-binding protein
LGVQGFSDTFGKKSTRKRPNLAYTDIDEMIAKSEEKEESYVPSKDRNLPDDKDWRPMVRDPVFSKGQSHRIWGELHKVLDSSDVVVEVLDARDPLGTRAWHVERHLKKNAPHKHLILLLNKADLVPSWALKRWLAILSKEYPVIAFHASITKPFGKGSLIQVLRQFQHLHSDKQQISVGFIGYPNVGKSSVINTLRRKKVCPAAPVPGHTKVWQYITLFKKIFLVDCPGVVYASDDTESDIVLKGVVRVESLEDAVEHIPLVLERCRKQHVINTYGIFKWEDHKDFLTQLSRKMGRLLPGNEPDLNSTAKIILHHWLNGKLPFFVAPPFEDGTTVPRGQLEREAKAAAEAEAKATGEADAEGAEETEMDSDKAFHKLAPPTQILKNLVVRSEYAEQKGPQDDVDKMPVHKDDDIIEESDDEESDSDDGDEVVDWDAVYQEADGSEDDEDLVPVNAENPMASVRRKSKSATAMDTDDADDKDILTMARHKRKSMEASRQNEDDSDAEVPGEEDDESSEESPDEAEPVALPSNGLTTIQMTKSIMRKAQPKTKKRKRNFDPSDADTKVIEGGFGHFKRSGIRKPRAGRNGNEKTKKSNFEVVPEGFRPAKKRKLNR